MFLWEMQWTWGAGLLGWWSMLYHRFTVEMSFSVITFKLHWFAAIVGLGIFWKFPSGFTKSSNIMMISFREEILLMKWYLYCKKGSKCIQNDRAYPVFKSYSVWLICLWQGKKKHRKKRQSAIQFVADWFSSMQWYFCGFPPFQTNKKQSWTDKQLIKPKRKKTSKQREKVSPGKTVGNGRLMILFCFRGSCSKEINNMTDWSELNNNLNFISRKKVLWWALFSAL